MAFGKHLKIGTGRGARILRALKVDSSETAETQEGCTIEGDSDLLRS